MFENNILQGKVDLGKVENTSLGKYLYDRIVSHGSRTAQIDASTGRSFTFADLVSQSRSVSEGLRRLGVRAEDVVAVVSNNRLEYSVTMLGTLYLGATVAPINPNLDALDMKHLLDLIKPRVVVCEPTCHSMMDMVKQDGTNTPLVLFEEESFRDLLRHGSSADWRPVDSKQSERDVAVIMCSSGTTGYPKGVMLTHHNWLSQIKVFRDVAMFNAGVFMCISAAYWVSGMFMQLLNMERGHPMVLLPTFSAETFLQAIHKYKVSFLILGPSNLVAVALYDDADKFDVSSLKGVTYGGAAMSKDLHLKAQQKLKLKISQVYGMTEVLGVCFGNLLGEVPEDVTTVGLVSPNTTAKVVDLKTGEALGPNREGELCFRAPTVMKGYLRNPEATKEVFDSDGWLHTGDVGYYNEDGHIYIVERIKELIKYKGVHIATPEIEGVLLSHPDVVDAAVVGVHHDLDQEHAVGCVVLKPGAAVTEQQLLQLVSSKLSEIKHLHGGLRILKELPKTGSGKTQKRLLRKLVQE